MIVVSFLSETVETLNGLSDKERNAWEGQIKSGPKPTSPITELIRLLGSDQWNLAEVRFDKLTAESPANYMSFLAHSAAMLGGLSFHDLNTLLHLKGDDMEFVEQVDHGWLIFTSWRKKDEAA